MHLPVGAFGIDHKPLAITEHPRSHAMMLKRLVVKVGQHRLFGRDGHRLIVM